MTELACIIDTECTGLKEPEPLEVGWTEPFPFSREPPELRADSHYYQERKPIEFGAMATHHLFPGLNSDVPVWPGEWLPPVGTRYLIGHNIDYDWGAIGKPDVKRICTLALARKQWPDIDSHSLGAMQYFIASHADDPQERYSRYKECADRLLEGAHSAIADIQSCANVLYFWLSGHPEITSWEELWQRSEKDRIPDFMNFGKYGNDSDWARQNNQPKGMRCDAVYDYDGSYYRWLFSGKCERVNNDPYLQIALKQGVRDGRFAF